MVIRLSGQPITGDWSVTSGYYVIIVTGRLRPLGRSSCNSWYTVAGRQVKCNVLVIISVAA
jgi:hypothetical protein